MNDCVIDELGWLDSESKTESQLKEFWEKTGVQPYVILKDYDPSLTSESEMEKWATDYYDSTFDRDDIFMYVYFAAQDTDNDYGYNAYAQGIQTNAVMDSEAVEIFWDKLDQYWFSDATMDEVVTETFNGTAKTIMQSATAKEEASMTRTIVFGVIAAGALIVILVGKKNKRDKEKAEEDQRILNTSIDDLADDSLVNKYTVREVSNDDSQGSTKN